MRVGWDLLAREYEEFERDIQDVAGTFHEVAIVGLYEVGAAEAAEVDEQRRTAETEMDIADAELEANFKLETAKDRERTVGWLALIYLVILVEQRVRKLKSRFDKSHPPKEKYPGKSTLEKLVNEFRDRFRINLEAHAAFEDWSDLVLARNEVVHHSGRPRDKYRKHTTRFIHTEQFMGGPEDLIVFSNSDFKESAEKMKGFVDWVVRQLIRVRDGCEPNAGRLRSLRTFQLE